MLAAICQLYDRVGACARPDDGVRGGARTSRIRTIQLVVQHLILSRTDRSRPKIREDKVILAELVHLKKLPTLMGQEPATDYVRRAVWRIFCADGAWTAYNCCGGLPKMIDVIVEIY